MKLWLKLMLIAAVTLFVAAWVSGTIFVVAVDPNQVRLHYGGTTRIELDKAQLSAVPADPNLFELRATFRINHD